MNINHCYSNSIAFKDAFKLESNWGVSYGDIVKNPNLPKTVFSDMEPLELEHVLFASVVACRCDDAN